MRRSRKVVNIFANTQPHVVYNLMHVYMRVFAFHLLLFCVPSARFFESHRLLCANSRKEHRHTSCCFCHAFPLLTTFDVFLLLLLLFFICFCVKPKHEVFDLFFYWLFFMNSFLLLSSDFKQFALPRIFFFFFRKPEENTD